MIGFRKLFRLPLSISAGVALCLLTICSVLLFISSTHLAMADSDDISGLVFEDNGIGDGIAKDGLAK